MKIREADTEAWVWDFTNMSSAFQNIFAVVSLIPSFGNDKVLTFVQHHMGLFGQSKAY